MWAAEILAICSAFNLLSQIKISENLINVARLFNLFKNNNNKKNQCQEERNILLWFLGKYVRAKFS